MVVQENLVKDRMQIMLVIPIWDIVMILAIILLLMDGVLLIKKMVVHI